MLSKIAVTPVFFILTMEKMEQDFIILTIVSIRDSYSSRVEKKLE